MRRTEIKAILSQEEIGAEVVVKGWVRNYRGNNFVMFVALNDGSSLQNLQIVIDIEKFDAQLLKKITVGSSLSITGIIAKSEGKGQSIEILASIVEVLGTANADEYPLQPKKHLLEFLREIGHLRFRSNTFGAITRIRHQMIYAIHIFLTNGFYIIFTHLSLPVPIAKVPAKCFKLLHSI